MAQALASSSRPEAGILAQIFLEKTGATAGRPSTGTVMNFAQNQQIYAEGGEALCFYKVVSGVVRVCKFLADGRRQIESFQYQGDIFGLDEGEDYAMSAEAASDCTVIAYRRSRAEISSAADADLSQALLGFALSGLARARAHSFVLGCRSASSKVAHFLLEHMGRSPDKKSVKLGISRQDMADYLGLTIETVSRTLSQFERSRIIVLSSAREIELRDIATLKEMVS